MAIIEPWPWLPRVGDLRHTAAAAVVDYTAMGHSTDIHGAPGLGRGYEVLGRNGCASCKTEIGRLRELLSNIVDESNQVVGRGKVDPRLARICGLAAQGIGARSGAIACERDPKDESPVPKECAQRVPK